MKKLFGFAALAALSFLAPAAASAADSKDVLVVSVAPLDDLLNDLKYIGELANQPGWHDIAKGSLANIGQGLKGLDKARPWGAIVTTDGENFGYVGVLPVTSLKDLLKGLEQFVGKAKSADGGAYQLTVPGSGMPVFVKEVGKWAYIGQNADAFDSLPADPSKAFGDLTGRGYDVGLRANCANVSEAHKQMALGFIEQGMQQGMAQQENESEAQYEARQKMMEMQMEQMKKAFAELDELSLGLSVDSSAKHGRLEMVVSGQEGTDMAKELNGYTAIDSKYSSFWDKAAAASMQLCMGIPKEAADRASEQIEPMKKQIIDSVAENDEIESEEDKELVRDALSFVLDQVVETVKKGKYDSGFKMDMAEKNMSMIAGAFVADGTKFEEFFRDMDKRLKAKDSKYPGIKFDSGKSGSVDLHTLSVPIPDDEEEAQEIFGDSLTVMIGTGPSDVFFSLGKNAKEAIDDAVKGVSSSGKKSDLPLRARVSLGPILKFASSVTQEAKVELASNIIKESPDADGVLITAAFEDGKEKVQYTLEEGVLRLISRSAELNEAGDEDE